MLYVWEIDSGAIEKSYDIAFSGGHPVGVKFIADGRGFAVISRGGVDGVDAATGARICSIVPMVGQAAPVNWCECADISPDDTRAVTAGRNLLCLWDLTKRTRSLPPGVEGICRIQTTETFSQVAFAGSNDRVVTRDNSGSIALWDLAKEKKLDSGFDDRGAAPSMHRMAVSPSGHRVLLGDGDRLELWDTRTGRKIHTLRPATAVDSNGYTGSAISSDGKLAASGDGRDPGRVRLWRLPP
jgi:WD40 repeat protein